MSYRAISNQLPGYEADSRGAVEIVYNIASGYQVTVHFIIQQRCINFARRVRCVYAAHNVLTLHLHQHQSEQSHAFFSKDYLISPQVTVA